MTVLTTELPYRPDAAARYAERLSARPWWALLDSGRPGSVAGRYDVLVADPVATVVTRGAWTELRRAGRAVERTREDPFAVLRAALGPVRPAVPGLPFAGGAVGYFGYDLGRRIERLPVAAVDDRALPDMAFGIHDWCLVVDHERRRVVLAASTAGELERRRGQLTPLETTPAVAEPASFQVLAPVETDMPRDAYETAFARIQRWIRDGDCYQVNLAQRFRAPVAGDPWQAYRWLRQLNPAPYGAFLRLPDGAVLSSSPERFIEVRDGEVRTEPIKGTRPRAHEPARDRALAAELAASAKDHAENVMIVDLLRNDLGRSCATGSVHVPELCAVRSFATVHHLVSTVRGRLAPGRDALALVRGAFPGGSITGAPKVRAMEIIESLETHRRGVYCGAIGYIGFDGAMDTNIAIRTLTVEHGQMRCWAGGGIVADSNVDAEYQECLDKARAMLRVFERTRGAACGW